MNNVPKIRMLCPNLNCRRVLAVPASHRGRTIRCSVCGTPVRVPATKPKPAPVPDDAESDAGGRR